MLDGEYVVDEETGEPPLLEEVDAEPDQIDIIAPGLPPS
jgi:hypothetical protein